MINMIKTDSDYNKVKVLIVFVNVLMFLHTTFKINISVIMILTRILTENVNFFHFFFQFNHFNHVYLLIYFTYNFLYIKCVYKSLLNSN